ncbi:MAG: PhoU domain-containing protein [Verrucomicrobiia bacterium]
MMASLTDRNFTMALNAYLERDDAKADLVETEDEVVDRLEMEIDEMVVNYIATHGAIATTCRLMITATKISEGLENFADQAVSIARRARMLNRLPEVHVPVDVLGVGKMVLANMRECISTFVDVEPERAAALVKKDKEIDLLTKGFEKVLHEFMSEHPDSIVQCMNLLILIRALERAGDSAKKIAGDVHFLYTAQDIRHEGATTFDSR